MNVRPNKKHVGTLRQEINHYKEKIVFNIIFIPRMKSIVFYIKKKRYVYSKNC